MEGHSRSEGARERGSEGTRERGNEGARERGNDGDGRGSGGGEKSWRTANTHTRTRLRRGSNVHVTAFISYDIEVSFSCRRHSGLRLYYDPI
jgi:hypothetical protein